ncbi:MAG: MFS transporter [Rhizobiaceae bacterium]|nr:MFS transporter [Rhizobiaceae bacterium]
MAGITILGFAYVLSQFYRSFLAVLTPLLTSELGMSESDLSTASGAWFATFALAQFPVGIWLDKYGPRRTASLMHGLFAAGGALLFATAEGPMQIIAAMAAIGIGCAPVLMATYILFARNYSIAMFATLASTFVGVGMIGNVAGAEPLAIAVEAWGWRDVAFGLALISLITSIGVFAIVKDPPVTKHSQKGSFLELFKIRQLWPLFPLIAVSYAVPAGIRGLWAGPYLDQIYGLDILAIGRIVLYIALAQIVGTIMYGPMDRIFNTRKWVAIVANSLVLASCIWLALNPDAALISVTLAFVGMALFGSAYAVQMAHGKSYFPAHMVGRGLTLLNFFSIGGVAVMQFASGLVVETFSVPQNPTAGYSALFAFYAIVIAAALAIYLWSKDAKPR